MNRLVVACITVLISALAASLQPVAMSPHPGQCPPGYVQKCIATPFLTLGSPPQGCGTPTYTGPTAKDSENCNSYCSWQGTWTLGGSSGGSGPGGAPAPISCGGSGHSSISCGGVVLLDMGATCSECT